MPIDTDLYLAFILATAVLILIPGPIVTLVIANALKHGTGTGIKTVIGANTGYASAILARLAATVVTVEEDKEVAEDA